MRLENKVALLTGGYGGMGRASARLFAQEGATVFISGRKQGGGEALAKEISDAGGKAFFVELEVTEQAQWDAAVEQIRGQAGGLHILMLGNERSHHMLTLLKKKDELQEKREEFEAFFKRHF
jgi:NAD(P)-dependent dehydrogenase (short-subunit alcohol dehydrogenase family)